LSYYFPFTFGTLQIHSKYVQFILFFSQNLLNKSTYPHLFLYHISYLILFFYNFYLNINTNLSFPFVFLQLIYVHRSKTTFFLSLIAQFSFWATFALSYFFEVLPCAAKKSQSTPFNKNLLFFQTSNLLEKTNLSLILLFFHYY